MPYTKAIRERRDKATHCCYCGMEFPLAYFKERWNAPTIDHLLPLCKGGTNKSANLVICCARCNRAKSGLLLEEFLQLACDQLHGLLKSRYFRGYTDEELERLCQNTARLIALRRVDLELVAVLPVAVGEAPIELKPVVKSQTEALARLKEMTQKTMQVSHRIINWSRQKGYVANDERYVNFHYED
jgi:hypothetical protein